MHVDGAAQARPDARTPERSSRGRASWRAVVLPAEHGGWGLTLEPVLLGILVAPSLAGVAVGLAGIAASLVRTPLRVVLLGWQREQRERRPMDPTRLRLARRVALLELVVLGLASLVAVSQARQPAWWLPGIAAAPWLGVALWYDARSRGRELLPEVAAGAAFASLASMGALVGGAPWPLALGLWLILGARVATSIPQVRVQVTRLHGRSQPVRATVLGDAAAVLLAAVAVVLDGGLVAGAGAIVVIVVCGRWWLARPSIPARTLGLRQMGIGFALVAVTALGVRLA